MMSRPCPSYSGALFVQMPPWIADHYFDDAKAGKWFDAVRMLAHRHPRAIRTMEYADHCDEIWGSRLPNPYPSFDEWRNGADSYIEAPSALPPVLGS